MTDAEDPAEFLELDDLLWLVAEMPAALVTVPEILADCRTREITTTSDQLEALAAAGTTAGLLATFEDLDGTVRLTLTPLAAERMGVRLDPSSTFFLPKRVHLQETVKPPPFEERVDRDLRFLADPTMPEPLDMLCAIESHGEVLADGGRVQVRHVVGIRQQWPRALREAFAGVCPGCAGERMLWNAYCAICDRSGVDRRLGEVEPWLSEQTQRSADGGPLDGGKGRSGTGKGAPRARATA